MLNKNGGVKISNLKDSHVLVKSDVEEYIEHLVINYLEKILADDHATKVYLRIMDEIEGFHIDGGKLYKNKEALKNDDILTIYPIYLKDRLGVVRTSHIVKKLDTTEDVYELRIDSEFEHERILVFPTDCTIKDLDLPFLTFSYGFTKGGLKKDLTQPLIEDSQKIRDNFYEGRVDPAEYFEQKG